MLQVESRSDVGVRRQINEDHLLADRGPNLVLVCDGMGGHAGGELASRLSAEQIASFVHTTRQGTYGPLPYSFDQRLPPEANRLAMAVRVANREVYSFAARNPALSGMGSTVAAISFDATHAHIAHVGDSRVYRWRQDRLICLTRDHSALNELIDRGEIAAHEAELFPDHTTITRALGVEPDVQVDLRIERRKDGDVFLLCTDGLTDLVSDRKISECLMQAFAGTPDAPRLSWLATELVRLANARGGTDNITLVIARYLE